MLLTFPFPHAFSKTLVFESESGAAFFLNLCNRLACGLVEAQARSLQEAVSRSGKRRITRCSPLLPAINSLPSPIQLAPHVIQKPAEWLREHRRRRRGPIRGSRGGCAGGHDEVWWSSRLSRLLEREGEPKQGGLAERLTEKSYLDGKPVAGTQTRRYDDRWKPGDRRQRRRYNAGNHADR